jgi:hypothetical protein
MSTSINHDNSITVVGYSLPEFCFELTELGAKGYTVSYENDKLPFGGMGSIYQCTVVPRHGYHIDKEGNHVNVPNTSQETALKDDSDDVSAIGGTDISETANTAKTAVKRTATKKTT